ncbi:MULTISPECIES: RsmB/NOP family class I SAM-dependent RNA methyltransferase [Gordonia]|uniref:Transcription antitermination factor NusB n=1 Tax=Gordonia amicalis TaxID=89053 RepID=A0AAE4U7S5_9ACTN|nr:MULTISPECIES: transcription antitermination factor NusB [Gordonia]ATD70798.1 methyltransferase [Gordonia sp. 1D]MCZ0913277.1 rRNA small subunit methyltransferase B [Gordonia amicalis]MCZ4577842.1 rRNA small subunit methyltransferase B [Gordonia amicalis]MCZ4652462.1 rRNA small subunit methyltransferase B [Gordonia amicalis]MDJ0451163.1 transcription antitermination factor NusB [Gordonia amicalis]
MSTDRRPNQGKRDNSSAKFRQKDLDPARVAARDTLRAIRERDAYANLVLPKMLRDRRIEGRDAAFATELAYGTARAQGLLDAVIASAAKRPVDEIDGPVLDVLRLGAYQLLRTRVGSHAAVSTSVDLVRSENGMGPSGFANAVLRKVSQKTEEMWVDELAPSPAEDLVGYLAFQYAHPRWIAEVFRDALGGSAGQLQAALAADDERPPVHLVARPGYITAEELALTSGGEEGRFSPYCVYLPSGDPGDVDAIREGYAGVQDEGSQLIARAVTVAEVADDSGRWLDMCAGPGGKAALIGALADIDGARLDAIEVSKHRAELIRKVVSDLPVTIHVADARSSGLEPGYDRILLDAPCSGLGSLRRRPESRWRRTAADVDELVALQKQLLTEALRLVKPGGIVVYSTCSPHPAETTAVVADVLASVDGARRLDARPLVTVGELGPELLGDGPHVQLWPHVHGTDAMFMAALTRD